MKILSAAEQKQFEIPPVFDSYQRKKFFDFPKYLLEISYSFRKPDHQIGFLISSGYFNAVKSFFAPEDYYQNDINYVAHKLNVEHDKFDSKFYANRTRQRHENIILKFYGFKRFDGDAETILCKEISLMVCTQLKPRLIFGRCIDILIQNRIQLPNSRRFTDLIRKSLNQRKLELIELIEQNISDETRELLEELFVQTATNEADDSPSVNTRYKLTLLKRISQSTKPTKIKERVADLQLLESLYNKLKPIIDILNFNHESTRYYAGSVIKSKIFQLNQRSDEDRYVYVIAFIEYQYYQLQDNLVDVLLSAIRTFQNSASREHKERIYGQRKEHNQRLSGLLSRLDNDVFSVINNIRKLTQDNQINDTEKINKIQALLNTAKDDELSSLATDLDSVHNEENYYDVLEERSVRLQNKVSPILKTLNFQSEPSATALVNAIKHFKDKDGNIAQIAPLEFLSADERKEIINSDSQKLRISLYKSLLFTHTTSAIKSGNLNLKHSYKYRPLDDYMIDKERWEQEKDQLLERAGLTELTNPKKILNVLNDALFQQYQTTNDHVAKRQNSHLKIFENGSFSIATPAQEEKESEPLQQFFPERHYVPLTEVLATVNQHCGFLDELQHWQQQHIRSSISHRSLYAGVIGLGCGIGTRKMGRISSQVTESDIEHAVNWYFSLENIHAANDRIVKTMDKMELPNIYRRSQDKLHTASDGQKFEVRTDSLNANHSFKYFGKGQGVSAYTFIDERGLLWHSLVISAAERESAYVIDGLMHNDVVKSDIHSTDTHGYSEVIFATTHLLGFSFAPRIKNLKKQSLYIFKSHKKTDQSEWKITPDKYINEKIIEDNWDDILRLITTIKLKETTASDIFRRMNSYSKESDLYKALKAFGQIIKSLFILRYLDELELRQAIEKQLNKVELANRFTRAVAVGNPREYTQAEKEDQEIAESCNRLIKNSIICWNYLYLTQKLSRMENKESKDRLLIAITTHSVISWAHINLLGEYDFSDEKLQDSVGILPPKTSRIKEHEIGSS